MLSSPAAIAPELSDVPDVDQTFLLWVRPFLELALVVNRRVQPVGDQDEALLYLAAWQFLLSDLAGRRDLSADLGSLGIGEGLSRLHPESLPASHIAALVEATGIPRETVRRKLSSLRRRGVLVARPDGTIQLAALRRDILDIAEPVFTFARWMLSVQGWPVDALGEPRSLRSFVALVRHYLAVYLSLLKSRRILTGTTSHVSVQLGINLLHIERVQALLAREGPPPSWDFATFVILSRRVFDETCYLRQVADVTGLSLAAVRASCRRLAGANGFITVTGSETLVVGGPGYGRDSVGSRRLYPEETRDHLQAFTRRAVERAVRRTAGLSRDRAPGPPAPTASR